MKSFRKYLFVVILLFCNLLCFAYEKLNLKGYIGSELSVPNKASDIIPDIKIRLSFLDSFKTGLRLSWNGKVIIYAGNITFSGTVSALKNPDFSLVLSPTGSSAFSATGISASLPSYSGSASSLAIFASFPLGIKPGSSFQITATEKNEFFTAFTIPFLLKKISITSVSIFGLYNLKSTLPDSEDAWFEDDLPYDKTWLFSGAEEIRVRTRFFRGQFMTGFFVSPFGSIDPWSRIRGVYNAGILSVDSGFYIGDYDIVSASNRIRSTLQFFVTPQVRFVFPQKNGSYIKFGVSFASDGKNADAISPFSVENKIRFGTELSLPMFRLRLYAGKQREKYVGDMEMLLRNLPIDMNFSFDVSGSIYPKNTGFFDKADLAFVFGIEPYGKMQSKYYFIPTISAKKTATIREGNFNSFFTEVAASWAYRIKFLTMRGKLAILL